MSVMLLLKLRAVIICHAISKDTNCLAKTAVVGQGSQQLPGALEASGYCD